VLSLCLFVLEWHSGSEVHRQYDNSPAGERAEREMHRQREWTHVDAMRTDAGERCVFGSRSEHKHDHAAHGTKTNTEAAHPPIGSACKSAHQCDVREHVVQRRPANVASEAMK
jgi:hypothetical protein